MRQHLCFQGYANELVLILFLPRKDEDSGILTQKGYTLEYMRLMRQGLFDILVRSLEDLLKIELKVFEVRAKYIEDQEHGHTKAFYPSNVNHSRRYSEASNAKLIRT